MALNYSAPKDKKGPICAEFKKSVSIHEKIDKNVGKILDNRREVWYSGLN